MKRKIIAALLCLVLIYSSVLCFATEPEKRIQFAGLFGAELYYCDSVRNKIVLKNVQAFGGTDDIKKQIITETEYNEVDVICGGVFPDGVKTEQEELNRYADSRVAVVLARTADGTVIVTALRFL